MFESKACWILPGTCAECGGHGFGYSENIFDRILLDDQKVDKGQSNGSMYTKSEEYGDNVHAELPHNNTWIHHFHDFRSNEESDTQW